MEYFKIIRNESGKPFFHYAPEGGGRYKCWMPVSESFAAEFDKMLAVNGDLADVVKPLPDSQRKIRPKGLKCSCCGKPILKHQPIYGGCCDDGSDGDF